MKIIYNSIFLEHDTGNHPENSLRLKHFFGLKDVEIENGEKYLTLVHEKRYVDFVKRVSPAGMPLDSDTLTSGRSYDVACFAAGAAVMAAKENGFAIVRPPGHHASRANAAGFCIFNNVAVASRYLLEEGRKVLILDFDLHHGNGTQDIFLGEKNVLYFSLHQSPQYPGTGLFDERNCLNVPLPVGTVDDVYIKQLEDRFVPALEEFKPDVVAVSAGFDGYYKDFLYMNPSAGFKLTAKSYRKIKEILKGYRSFYVLEGGYNPESIYEGVEALS